MRISAFVLALVTTAMFAPRPAAAAYNLPWCAQHYDSSFAFSCAFYTQQQCLATMSGVGGNCIQNPRLPPPPAAAYDEPRRAKRHHHARLY
jgi:hypothetical protein